MATKASSAQTVMAWGKGTQLAINKTRGLAFARSSEREEWQPVNLRDVGDLDLRDRVSHTKIGTNWFAIYKPGDGGQ